MDNPVQVIMLIEDNQDDCEAIIRGFKSVGVKTPIKSYKNCQDAIDHLDEIQEKNDDDQIPALILLDLNLPGIDGREMLRILKSHPHLKRIPVSILTTSTDQKDVSYCYDIGANTYIQKPVSFDKMKEVCSELKRYWFDIAILPEKIN